ncbi:putative helicase senataxin [Brachionus plicatilis]|uniref:Putative helicase senataxin n=1 Tax=Brachionus plicatilis TaxID=10195 RepID=A0A3M7PZL7_BRAPC|nr:putative helicase senataxin [Brachionus plicatilis]
MSQKVYPLFEKCHGAKKRVESTNEDEDCIVYLGEELSTDLKSCDHVTIKQEASEPLNDSSSEIFQLYSQEEDSIIDEDSVYHNSFHQIEPSKPELEEEDDDDEDIKLIYDSRDLIEQICRKYDTVETAKEKSPGADHSPIVVKQKSEPEPVVVDEDSNSSDMDVLLCSVGDQFEKSQPKKSFVTKQGLDVIDNFQTLRDSLFGDDLDSLSSEEEQPKIARDDSFKKSLSSRTPVRPPVSIKTNSASKRTISTEHQEKSKKQKLSLDESLFEVDRPPIGPVRSHIRKPLFANMAKKTNSGEITSKKTVELMLNKRFKPGTSVNQSLAINLTQSMNLARQENRLRERMRSEKLCQENKKPEGSKEAKPAEIVKEKETRSKKVSSDKNDVVGSILNKMNVQHANKENEKKAANLFIFENFLFRILKWSYNWLEEQSKFSGEMKQVAAPPVVDDQELGPLIDSYLSYDDYYKTMFPLLLAETWEEIFHEWKEAKRHEPKRYQNSPIWLKSVDKVSRHQELMALTFQILIDSGQKGFPYEDDLLRINLKVKIKETCTLLNYFGIVRATKRLKTDDPMIMNAIKDLLKEKEEANKKAAYTDSRPNKGLSVHEFHVFVRSRSYVTTPGLNVDYQERG